MNILPKKRWHVRTKDNIARVRRDEAEALEEERKRIEKQEFAESESRLNLLRSKTRRISGSSYSIVSPDASAEHSITKSNGHIDLFSDFKDHVKTVNKDYEKEKKEEEEKNAKQIGYLTYLGQDTNEALKLRSWYETAPKRAEVGDKETIEISLEKKLYYDPMTLFASRKDKERKSSKTGSKNHKTIEKPKLSKSTSSKNIGDDKTSKKEMIERLRKERLKREAREQIRKEQLIFSKMPGSKPNTETSNQQVQRVQKYNSQFNPHLAKQ